ncbi:MAG: biotin--[acetyl-CoA-carboxylase] ligase [Myxococcales bacterium]|nr:biotin--[acetyl-CoA-carboxylase] ligase [Myxococcales bacterium]
MSEDFLWLALEETTSTNTAVRELVMEGRAREIVCWARRQTQGRGRLGRSWLSPEGGLYFSWAVPVGGLLPTWLQPLAGMAVLDVLDAEDGDFGLKWPNDILVRFEEDGDVVERKMGGILSEYLPNSPQGPHVIVGIGLNLNKQVMLLPEDLAKHAMPPASLAEVTGKSYEAEEIACSLSHALRQRFLPLQGEQMEQATKDLHAAWSKRCWTLGRKVRILRPNGDVLEGDAVGIGEDLSLQVKDAVGVIHAVAAGDCRHARLVG